MLNTVRKLQATNDKFIKKHMAVFMLCLSYFEAVQSNKSFYHVIFFNVVNEITFCYFLVY